MSLDDSRPSKFYAVEVTFPNGRSYITFRKAVKFSPGDRREGATEIKGLYTLTRGEVAEIRSRVQDHKLPKRYA
jgi:hypothetical protein